MFWVFRQNLNMNKRICLAAMMLHVLTACSTPAKPVDPEKNFDTGIGFKFKPPPGEWFPLRTPDDTGYVLGRKPSKEEKAEGRTLIAEVRFGYINSVALKLTTQQDTLNFIEKNMRDPKVSDRFETTTHEFNPTLFKDAQCRHFKVISKNDKQVRSPKGEPLKVYYRGLFCIHPKAPTRYIMMALSERAPVGQEFSELRKEENMFQDSLTF